MSLALVCLKIFFGRIADVSIGTIRTIISVKGRTFMAAFLAFFEVLIWYYIAREAINTPTTSILVPISYALGYATGTYIGTTLSKTIIRGNTSVQVVTTKATLENIRKIRDNGFAVTAIDIYDSYDGQKKKLLLIEIKNHSKNKLIKLINSIDNKAFITYRETTGVANGFLN